MRTFVSLSNSTDIFYAFIIACYGDPGLQAAREITTAPVIGIAEASFYMASMLAARFSVVTVLPRIKTMLEELVIGYGMQHRVVNIRTTPLCVLDFERDPEAGLETLRQEGKRAVEEDYAEAIVDLGKTTSKLKTYKFPEKKEFIGQLSSFGNLVK